uniref:Replication factor A C-terminal domain-containing protein n=1 Tax=Oryza rufipogon TaxID=4529 RepID=A0A0E0MTY1_ORYRU
MPVQFSCELQLASLPHIASSFRGREGGIFAFVIYCSLRNDMEPSRFVRICPRKLPHDAIGIMTAIGPVQTVSCGVVMKAVLNVHITNGSLHGNPQAVRAIKPNFGQKEAVHVKVSDICDLNPHEALGNSYIVKIAIKDLAPAEAWWYIACSTCKRGAGREGNTYKCSRCITNAIETRVAIVGVDPSDLANHDAKTAEFTFFGEIGYQLIGIPILNLVASVQGARGIVPSEIKTVFGKQYVIRISVSRGSLQRTRISYQVDSLMLASPDAAHTGTLPSHDASVASSQHGSSPADAIEPHTIIGSSLQSMTPSTPLVLPDPKVLAMAQPNKKRKSSAIDEDLAQEGSSPREHDCQKASVVRALFVDKLPPQPPKCM